MSVAYDLEFASAQPAAQPHALALVPPIGAPVPVRQTLPRYAGNPSLAVLRPLEDPAPLRLTRRGTAVLSAVLAAAGLVIVVVGALSARSSGAAAGQVGPAVVTVHAGDTLWSIASRAAPGQDPRSEIASIERLNALNSEALVPGQRLRLR